MKCACPWCEKDAEEGCESLISGEPTCQDHSWEGCLSSLEKAMKNPPALDLLEDILKLEVLEDLKKSKS